MTSSSQVDAVVVSYNVRELLLACVTSLVRAQDARELAEIVVVDNASRDGSAGLVRDRFPSVRVIEAANNGYGAGANIGIAATGGDYVMVLNPDTVVPDGAVPALVEYLDMHVTTAVAGPLLRYPDGRVQSSRRRFPTRLTPLFESTIVEEWWPHNRWVRRYRMEDVPGDIPQQVDWVVGAALLLRRSALDRVGGFDEAFRMYSEDIDLCWRLRRHGWRTGWTPAAEVVHYESASASQDVVRRQLDFDTSRVRLTRRMFGPWTAQKVRTGLLLGYNLFLAREAAKWALGHQRPLRRARIALYTRGLRSRLRDGGER